MELQVGVIVGLISTSLQAIGLTLQRKSHILEDEKYPYDLHRPPYKRRRWQVGDMAFGWITQADVSDGHADVRHLEHRREYYTDHDSSLARSFNSWCCQFLDLDDMSIANSNSRALSLIPSSLP